LSLQVIESATDEDRELRLKQLLSVIEGKGIIYVRTVRDARHVAAWLKEEPNSFNVEEYHARLNSELRKKVEEKFVDGSLKAIVATIAFGMGIDIPDVRFVIHYKMPGSPMAYFQQIGRAGRDLHLARCIMLYTADDRKLLSWFVEQAFQRKAEIEVIFEAIRK